MPSSGAADERRLRVEVALLTGIAPGWFVPDSASIGRRFPGGEMVMESGFTEGPRPEFEAGLEAALAARLLTQDEAAWLHELTRLCRQPLTPVPTMEETGMADMRVHLALDTAAALGLLDEEDRRRHEERLEQLYFEREAERDADEYDDLDSEPLTGFKGIAGGPAERNGMDKDESRATPSVCAR